jgi:hypothetical protein
LAHEAADLLVRQQTAHKVGFIREKRKAASRDRQGVRKIGSFYVGVYLFGPFCWGGELGVKGGVVF